MILVVQLAQGMTQWIPLEAKELTNSQEAGEILWASINSVSLTVGTRADLTQADFYEDILI